MRISTKQWLEYLKNSEFEPFSVDLNSDVFSFIDYAEKLAKNKEDSKLDEAVLTGIADKKYVAIIFEPFFMMGTMSYGVGRKIINAINIAIEKKLPVVTITASGGARLQEGIFSVVQMATIQFAVNDLKNAGLKSINILADPTMGGVSASFAFLADTVVAIENAQIGFTGKEVIKQNLLEEIPDNFQTPARLLEDGLISKIIKPELVAEFLESEING